MKLPQLFIFLILIVGSPFNLTAQSEDKPKSYPAMLRDAGYRTCFIGKVGFTVTDEDQRPSTPTAHYYKWYLGGVFDFFAGNETHDRNGIVMWQEDDPGLKEIYSNRSFIDFPVKAGSIIFRTLSLRVNLL